jgi:hypothetical protein
MKFLDFHWQRHLKNTICQGMSFLSRSIDLSTDPGLKLHFIAFPCLERAATSTRTFI